MTRGAKDEAAGPATEQAGRGFRRRILDAIDRAAQDYHGTAQYGAGTPGISRTDPFGPTGVFGRAGRSVRGAAPPAGRAGGASLGPPEGMVRVTSPSGVGMTVAKDSAAKFQGPMRDLEWSTPLLAGVGPRWSRGSLSCVY